MDHFMMNIIIISANSPQAKGRVERGNQTHQDRLIKLMRLKNRPVSKIIFTQKTNYTKKTSLFMFLIRRRIEIRRR
jgi:hypothetical protein